MFYSFILSGGRRRQRALNWNGNLKREALVSKGKDECSSVYMAEGVTGAGKHSIKLNQSAYSERNVGQEGATFFN